MVGNLALGLQVGADGSFNFHSAGVSTVLDCASHALQAMTRYDLYCPIHRESKALAEVRMNALVPGERVLQVCIRFR